MNARHELLLDEVRSRVTLLKSSLPQTLDGFAISPNSKLPFKVMWYREALIWRMAELTEAAQRQFENGDLIAAIVLTRAAVETTAALWYLHGKVDTSVSRSSLGDIDTYLMKLVVGVATSADDPNPAPEAMPRPVKIGKFLESVEHDVEGFSRQYGVLSEYSHPNRAGTTGAYSRIDHKTAVVTLGKYVRHENSMKTIGLSHLGVALAMFEQTYNGLGKLIPAFVHLCERNRVSSSNALHFDD